MKSRKRLANNSSGRQGCIVSIPVSMSHVYLIPCQVGYLQIDTEYEHDYSLYRKNLARAGIALESIRYLLLTHHHDDHAGFLNDLTRDADLTIIAHEQADELLRTGTNDKTRGGGYVNGVVKLAAGFKMRFDPRWAFCGDAAASFLLWAGMRYCTVFMTDMDEAYRSWEKLLNAAARTIYPAHGSHFPADRLRQNIGRIKNEDLAVFF